MAEMDTSAIEIVSAITFWVAALVIVAAGFLKVQDPDPLHRAMAKLSIESPVRSLLPVFSPFVVRILGTAEVVVGLWALSVGGRVVGMLMALSYLFFSVVVTAARRMGVESCGCFGQRTSRPTITHVVLNVVLGVGSAVASFTNPQGIWDETAPWSVGRVPSVVGVVLLAIVVVVANTNDITTKTGHDT